MDRETYEYMCELLDQRDWWESVLEDAIICGNVEKAEAAEAEVGRHNVRLGSYR